jgi:hypothetical protein
MPAAERTSRESILAETLTLAALGRVYSRDGKQEEARLLIQEAIGHCERHLAVSPDDRDFQGQLFELVVCVLSDQAHSENDQLYERGNARAIALLERLKSFPHIHVGDMSLLSRVHRFRADHLMLREQSERAEGA